jgi:pyridinium-3,5-bisthiocarboxylic acid mononucleotide nickel chelatase
MILYFDCFSGLSGDMALGALLDCGVPLDALRDGLSSLPVEGWHLDAEPTLISGIHAMNVRITLHGVSDEDELAAAGRAQAAGHSHEHHHVHSHGHHHEHHHSHEHHSHDHDHSHSHVHSHSHDHSPLTTHHAHHGRSMAEIRAIIEGSALSERVKATSLAIFEKIALAEAEMHHTTMDEVHFHEIGGVDSLIDICGVAWCLEYLGVSEVHSSALPLSSGFVDCAHGRMPVPAPATLKILQGVPMLPTDIKGEMVTPTGAAIVATLAQSFGAPPAFAPRAVGHGAGKKRFADRPNMARALLGDKTASSKLSGLEWRSLCVVECNVDDMNPELWDHVMARLFALGALDVWLQGAQMKKNRPGTVLSALCSPETRDELIAALLRETTTLGVRVRDVQRAALPRRSETVETQFGPVRVKVAEWPEGHLRRAVPEYDDVARLAAQQGVAAREVYEAAQKGME